jgi:hypothetical protein
MPRLDKCHILVFQNGYYLPFKVDAETSVRREETPFDVVEVVVVLEQQGNTVQIPGANSSVYFLVLKEY